MVFFSLAAFLSRNYFKLLFWAQFGTQNRIFKVLPAINLILFYENCVNVSQIIVKYYPYMVFIGLGAFLSRIYRKMVFWTNFGPQSKEFRLLSTPKNCQNCSAMVQVIHINCRNVMMHGLYQIYIFVVMLCLNLVFTNFQGLTGGSQFSGDQFIYFHIKCSSYY